MLHCFKSQIWSKHSSRFEVGITTTTSEGMTSRMKRFQLRSINQPSMLHSTSEEALCVTVQAYHVFGKLKWARLYWLGGCSVWRQIHDKKSMTKSSTIIAENAQNTPVSEFMDEAKTTQHSHAYELEAFETFDRTTSVLQTSDSRHYG